jgi:hypothetical protein
MLRLIQTISVSELVQKRSEGLRAVQYDVGKHTIIFQVGPIGKEFEDLVFFDVKREVAYCSRLKDGTSCESNQHGGLCAHVWAAYQQVESQNQKQVA